MSLTDFVEKPQVRNRLADQFPNQGRGATNPLKANWQTENYSLVGTAFDYLLRFWLQRKLPTCHTRQWVAKEGLAFAVFGEDTEDVQAVVTRAKTERDEYLESGEISRALIEAALDLARADIPVRTENSLKVLGEYDEKDVIDCIRLLDILDGSEAFDGSVAHLNPVFGSASKLVGGADADVILDGTLIDVKATKKSTFKATYWRQLVGYLVLADIQRTLLEEDIISDFGQYNLPEVEAFGVYFARHGELSTVPATEVYESEHYSEFRSWFVTTALDQHAPFEGAVDKSWFERFQ